MANHKVTPPEACKHIPAAKLKEKMKPKLQKSGLSEAHSHKLLNMKKTLESMQAKSGKRASNSVFRSG